MKTAKKEIVSFSESRRPPEKNRPILLSSVLVTPFLLAVMANLAAAQVPVFPAETIARHHVGGLGGNFLELKDGRVVRATDGQWLFTTDGGENWIDGGSRRYGDLLRLKSGAIGVIDDRDRKITFSRSDDEGKTWSQPVQMSEPHVHTGRQHDSAIVTSSGRIVVPVYRQIGRREMVPEQKHFVNLALKGDEWMRVGSHDFEPVPELSWVYYSDDEGQTWHRNANGEMMVTLDYEAGGNFSAEEPVAVEYAPEHLLMLYRTPLGRLFQSWSSDDGTNWTLPRPSTLSASRAPAALKRIPGTDDLLVVWNQASGDEIQRGLQRHRLSAAISQNGGASWKMHKNIVCIDEDDRSYVEPSPVRYYRSARFSPRLPASHCWAIYPAVIISKGRVIISYYEVRNRPLEGNETRPAMIVLPIEFFYKKGTSMPAKK